MCTLIHVYIHTSYIHSYIHTYMYVCMIYVCMCIYQTFTKNCLVAVSCPWPNTLRHHRNQRNHTAGVDQCWSVCFCSMHGTSLARHHPAQWVPPWVDRAHIERVVLYWSMLLSTVGIRCGSMLCQIWWHVCMPTNSNTGWQRLDGVPWGDSIECDPLHRATLERKRAYHQWTIECQTTWEDFWHEVLYLWSSFYHHLSYWCWRQPW